MMIGVDPHVGKGRGIVTEMNDLEPTEFARIKALLRPQDRHRLRPDGLLEPDLPPLHVCGGLEAPYLTAPASSDRDSLPTSDAQILPPR